MEWDISKQQTIMKFSFDLSKIDSLALLDENTQKTEILKYIF